MKKRHIIVGRFRVASYLRMTVAKIFWPTVSAECSGQKAIRPKYKGHEQPGIRLGNNQ